VVSWAVFLVEELTRPTARTVNVQSASRQGGVGESGKGRLAGESIDISTDSRRSHFCNPFPINGMKVVAEAGIEPATRGFSIRCSTN
jgi:hypothetical protein